MKKIILFFSIIVLTVMFYGCPYESQVAIDSPNIKVDKSYTGIWVTKGGNTKYLVTKLDEYHLKIAQLPTETKEGENTNTQDTTIYHAHFSKVNNMNFLNIRQKTKYDDAKNTVYYLYKFTVKDANEISLVEVTSNIKEKFSTSEKLKSFIEKYMDLSFFFGVESLYVREL